MLGAPSLPGAAPGRNSDLTRTSLQNSLHSGAYLARVAGEGEALLSWAAGCGRAVGERSSAEFVNGVAVDYIQFLYDSGAAKGRATHGLLGLQRLFFPGCGANFRSHGTL